MTDASGVWAFIPAGGRGLRMQSSVPKQYLLLSGRPVILHTIERLCAHPRIRGVMVGVSDQDNHWQKLAPELARLSRFLGTSSGGETRAHTVLNGLGKLASHAKLEDWVLVHDAVRPCVRLDDINKLISDVDEKDGGLLAFPVSDTVKRVDETGRIIETVDRKGLWRAATPQMFRVGKLKQALEKALHDGVEVTDEASAIESMGGRPHVVACHADNIKITLPDDLALAELYLKQQQGRV